MSAKTFPTALTNWRASVVSLFSEHPSAVDFAALLAFYLVVVAAKVVWVSGAQGPLVFGDEFIYKTAAQSVAAGMGVLVEGKPLTTYPPLYPVLLSLGFRLGPDWYSWILRINALASSLYVFPVWWIARTVLPRRTSWGALFLASLTPFQVIQPRLVMSENLFLPLVLAALATVVLDTHRPSIPQCIATGAIWAMAELTRYIFLPALFVLPVLWWVQPWLLGNLRLRQLFVGRIHLFLSVAAGFALVFVPWIYYLSTIGATLRTAFGFNAVGRLADPADMIANSRATDLAFWATVSAAYLILGAAPYLHLLLTYPLRSAKTENRRELFFGIAFLALLGAFAVTVVYYLSRTHVSRAYIEGRYLMYLFPLLPVAALVSLRRLSAASSPRRAPRLWVTLGIAMAGIYLAYRLLISRSLLGLPSAFSGLLAPAPDAIAFFSTTIPLFGTLIRLLFALLVVQIALVTLLPRRASLALLCTTLVFGYAALSDVAVRVEQSQAQASHGWQMAQVLQPALSRHPNDTVQIELDRRAGVDIALLANSLRFWGVERSSFSISPAQAKDLNPVAFASEIVLTRDSHPDPSASYQVNDAAFYIYAPDYNFDAPAAVHILAYGPTEAALGQPFNLQADGTSGLWLKTSNASPTVVLVLGGRVYPTLFGGPEYLTASIPPDSLTRKGTLLLFLFDPTTQDKSNVVPFTVN
ncbi:MAG: glycosyltransferase family 39 protein [Chloroflexi bacterium]|nr:glycosyltransferase family 39 protein [Chloroflexota bacterium]